jgi:hypothetical protein
LELPHDRPIAQPHVMSEAPRPLLQDVNSGAFKKSINLRGLMHDSAVRMMRKGFIFRGL